MYVFFAATGDTMKVVMVGMSSVVSSNQYFIAMYRSVGRMKKVSPPRY
jgi:hypothetical protein